MPARTGQQYLSGLREQAAEVYISGERVTDVTTHPALRNGAATVASLYDMQHRDSLGHEMTYISPSSGEPVGLSFITPRTQEDLQRRHTMMSHWAQASCGMMGRSPDFMNVTFMAMAAASDYFSRNRPEFKDNIERYYEYIRENDLTLTHTLVNLQRDRSPMPMPLQDRTDVALKVTKQTDSGIVVRGPRVLATLGPLADEIAVYPALNHQLSADAQKDYSFAFAIPCNYARPQVPLPRELRHGPLPLRSPPCPLASRRWMPSCSSTMCLCLGSACSCWATRRCATTCLWPPTASFTPVIRW